MSNFIESYFGNNFTNATSSFAAGMNFTNLIIAIPLLTTFILLVIDSIRSPRKPKILDTKFQIITLISYVLFVAIAIYYKNLPDLIINIYSWLKLLLINHYVIIVLAYIPFMFLAWCIYDDKTQNLGKTTDKYENSELKKIIKDKITQLQNEDKSQNILINGHWGSGKTNFTKNTLSKSINSSIYISCTDYPDMFELVNALVYKSNNFIMRQLIRFSLGKLLSIISKTELRKYVGNKNVIIFDEFERLVDYNKIDHMHIVSLIQYLNSEKNCICVLVANEDHINNANQFTNVREKLISYTYHYKIPFDDVIKIIQDSEKRWLEKFPNIYQELKDLYNIDNNIRIIEHLYIKIDQIYTTHKGFIEFKQSNDSIRIKEEEFFALLFSNILDLISPLYYLYLKKPYSLKAIGTLAIIYKNMKEKSTAEEKSKNPQEEIHYKNLRNYLDQDSIQYLALGYMNEKVISYKNSDNELYDISYDLNYIITNQNFEHINAKLITNFLGNAKIVTQLILHNNEYGKTINQNIKFFLRLFKETFCEDDDQKLINNYFRSINVLEQRFLRLIDDVKLAWDYSIVTDYIAYCQYIDQKWPRGNPNNIRPVSYNRGAYINALTIQYLWEKCATTYNNIIDAIRLFYSKDKYKKTELIPIIYELTVEQAVKKLKLQEYINLILQIVMRLLDSNQQEEDHLILLNFMYQSYDELKNALLNSNVTKDKEKEHPKNILELCNKNMINLITPQNKTRSLLDQLFMHLSNFNDRLSSDVKETSFNILIEKIKEIYNTDTLKQEFIDAYINQDWDIPKQVAEALQAELDTATEQQSNPTQENSDNKQ